MFRIEWYRDMFYSIRFIQFCSETVNDNLEMFTEDHDKIQKPLITEKETLKGGKVLRFLLK